MTNPDLERLLELVQELIRKMVVDKEIISLKSKLESKLEGLSELGVCLGCRVIQKVKPQDAVCDICHGGTVVDLNFYLQNKRGNDFKDNDELKKHYLNGLPLWETEQYQKLEQQVKELQEENKRLESYYEKYCILQEGNDEITHENQDLKQKIEKIEHIEWTQIFNFKSDDIPIKDYFPKEWAKLKSILESNNGNRNRKR